MSVNSKMKAIADKIRSLLGISLGMGLDAMATNLDTVQGEVDTQADLIDQLHRTLADKATGIVPSGDITITENGTHDVTEYANAVVDVEGFVPTGDITINENGTHDVAQYANAVVNVPGITPSGSKTITTNGTHDVTEYANVEVDVPSKEPVLQEKNVSPSTSGNTVTPDPGYDGLSKVNVSAVKTATQATPSISVSSSGLITASATQTEGYVSSGTKSATKQLTTQGAQIITPGTSDKTIASGRYLTGTQTIKGDADLVAGNIKKGVTIFNVTGTLESMPGEIQAVKSGSFVPDQNYSSGTYTVQHGLGVEPNFAIVWATDYANLSSKTYMLIGMTIYSEGAYSEWIVYKHLNASSSSVLTLDDGSLSASDSFDVNSFIIKPSSSMALRKDVTYKWIVARINIE